MEEMNYLMFSVCSIIKYCPHSYNLIESHEMGTLYAFYHVYHVQYSSVDQMCLLQWKLAKIYYRDLTWPIDDMLFPQYCYCELRYI